MKVVLGRAIYKAACSFLLLIVLTIGYEYITWLQYDPADYATGCADCNFYKMTKAERRELAVIAGQFHSFSPDLWPFNRPLQSSW